MFIALEGLDGAGKSTLLKKISNELYESHKISSFMVNPLEFNPKLLNVINTKNLTPFDKFNKTIKEHLVILDNLKEYQEKYDVVFLDRSIYSGYAYTMFEETDYNTQLLAKDYLKQIHNQYNIHSLFLNTPEKIRIKRIKNRNEAKLFDNVSGNTSFEIYNCFILLALFNCIKFCTSPISIKKNIFNKLKENNLLKI